MRALAEVLPSANHRTFPGQTHMVQPDCARAFGGGTLSVISEALMKPSTGNPAPGYKTHPEHRITTKPAGMRVRVTFNGELIADSNDAIVLEESKYPPVYYLPRGDVKMDRLERSSHRTYCPFKGAASYFSLKNGPENAVWSYEQPYDEMAVLKDRLAFYPDKVDSISELSAVVQQRSAGS
jgi:uncharacterized protein (DUF427 family)